MAVTTEYLDYLKDQFSILSNVTVKRMFGGAGVFRHGLMFAVYVGDGIALKADKETIPDFQNEDCVEWLPEKKNGTRVSMGYWYAPEFIFDDEDELRVWAEKAFEAAVRFDRKKPPSQQKLNI